MKRIHQVVEKSFSGKKAIVVNLKEDKEEETEESSGETRLLCKTLRLRIVKEFTVKLNYPHPATFLGEGKLQELKRAVDEVSPAYVIFGRDLMPVQQRNIEDCLKVEVIDRTGVILQIFGQHAKSKEGKIQIELAQLGYMLPRLAGHGTELSRIGGGFATRGPGEMKIEVYRRRIKERIYRLRREIKDIEKHRKLIRESRRRSRYPVISLMGYTNVGKSSLLNSLSASRLYVADKLFATLDPASRAVFLGDGHYCLVSDTVGLLHDIPHHLIEAFQSTLEEVKYADMILVVYDISAKNIDRQKKTVSDVFHLLGIEDKKILEVYNKTDLLAIEEKKIMSLSMPEGIFVSAASGEGIRELKEILRENLYGTGN